MAEFAHRYNTRPLLPEHLSEFLGIAFLSRSGSPGETACYFLPGDLLPGAHSFDAP
jgi:hypothetical protein